MSTPFALSFDEIKAQADANMAADKGQAAGAQAQDPAGTGKGKSFLEMVENAAQMLAQDAKKPAAESLAVKEPALSDEKPASQAGALSFDDMFAGAQNSGTTQTPSFDDMFAGAQNAAPADTAQAQEAVAGAAQTPSFDDMFADAQNTVPANASRAQETAAGAAQTPSFDDMFAGAPNTVPANASQTETAAETSQPAKDQPVIPSFDEMFAQSQQTAQPAAQGISFDEFINAPQDPASDNNNIQPAGSEAKTETQAEEAAAEETPAQEEAGAKEEAPVVKEDGKTPVKDTAQAEEEGKGPEAGKPTAKRSRKSKKTAKEEEKKEPLPDITADFKVDVLGESKSGETPATKAEEGPASDADSQPLAMDALFTPDEIAAFRADIRAFVRREFKLAMVGAVKELLKEFGE